MPSIMCEDCSRRTHRLCFFWRGQTNVNIGGGAATTQFLKRLETLFELSKGKGSIWLNHKRLVYGEPDDANGAPPDDRTEYPCLIRAMDGGKTKFSTRVEPVDLENFHSEYGILLKASMSILRKRDKKREKLRAEQFAKKKKRLTEEVAISGPKRGAGRKKRKRLITAAVKLTEFKKRAAEKDAVKATSS
ncbi:signal recognition particle SRP9/SRP14 subunit [Thelephora ganbajun]|uniref:Signal recognition particle SRP9/SRP14 subunit n=1 Tax=Thelephora ganbajun TaxID=370292 RepID=A0ACB6ZMB1_THEGA|nr:signal recognition particle SRP9/SRP14 subunit [Thelephora ganbajun]